MYRALDAVLLRAATHPAGDDDLPAWPDLTDDTGATGRAWLAAVWSRPFLAEPIALASPVLAAQVARLRDGDDHDPRQVRRTVLSVARYLLRMTGRATPFGLFAGVAAGRIDEQPAVRWGQEHRPVVRVDAGWLNTVVTELELCPPLLRRLPVMVNNLCVVRAGRLTVPFQQPADDPDGPELADISVRHTPAVAAAIRYARTPIIAGDLAGKLADDIPHAAPAVIENLLVDLVRARVLLTGLRPPMSTTDGLGYVLATLDATGAEAIAELSDRVRALRAIHTGVLEHNHTADPASRLGHRTRLASRMASVNSAAAGHPIMVDLRLDVDVTLPDVLLRHAEAAASALTRLTPNPQGLPFWQEYHAAFLDRYGVNGLVPLLEVTDSAIGLGLPATYRGSPRRTTVPPSSDRDRRLLKLAYATVLDGSDEINLDERTIATIVGEQAAPSPAPAHVELFLRVHATDVPALRRGQYELWVTGAARSAGATTGRFLDLLDPADQDRFRTAYTGVPAARGSALPAQVSSPPLSARLGNLARAQVVAPAVLPVGEFPTPNNPVISLEDVAVGGDADGLYLVWLSRQRLIEPAAFNAVEFRHFSHPLARFLSEVTRARAAVYQPFSWGTAAGLPLLPRIRYGRTVLSPARWNLPAADLPGPGAPWQRWCAGLASWQHRHRMPETVYLVEADNLLPLDLTEHVHLMILRSHLDRYGRARLDEAPPASAYGWLDGHAHEIVVPLGCAALPAPGPHAGSLRPVGRDHGQLPGASSRLYAKLYAPPDRHGDLLTRLPDVFTGWDRPIRWWYLPYRDPEPHLRLRLLLPAADDYGPATHRLGAWATRQRDDGLLGYLQLDTYHPETGRYGHGPALAAVEHFFVADSTAALAQQHTAIRSGVPPEAITAASLVDLAISLAGDTDAGMRWLTDHLPLEPVPVPRTLHTTATRLADPSDDWANLRDVPGGDQIWQAWCDRRTALVDYRQHLATQRDPYHVLPSLLHLHHIRALGMDPDRERVGRRLARAAALRWTATTTAAIASTATPAAAVTRAVGATVTPGRRP